MLAKEYLFDTLHQAGLSRKDQLLLVLAVEVDRPKQVREIVALATDAGLVRAKKWNVSDILSKSKGMAGLSPNGWKLTETGKQYLIAQNFLPRHFSQKQIISSLRDPLSRISDSDTIAFVTQAIECFEAGYHRAAVVLSWIGAVSVLYRHVEQNCLSSFNREALRRDQKWRSAKNADDLVRMKEFEFLNVLEAISEIGKNVKHELQEKCLKLRNGCGHPNSLEIGPNAVAAHLELLVLNVFSKY